MMHFISDANAARLAAIKVQHADLDERRDEQHVKRAERAFNRRGGDPSKRFEEGSSQSSQCASGDAVDETAFQLSEDVEEAISSIEEILDRVGPPERGLFTDAWVALKAYRQHLNMMDDEDFQEGDWEE